MRYQVIYSVPHTGTYFLIVLLGIKARHYDTMPEAGGLIISPIRDPWQTYRSWVTRGRSLAGFDRAWRNFNAAFERLDVAVVPIDTPDRDEHLAALSERLERDLSTDWAAENVGPPAVEIARLTLDHIYNLPVVQKYYEH